MPAVKYGRNINVRFETADFEKKAEQARQIMLAETADSLKYIANVFSNSAAKGTPPCMGKLVISKEWYERPYLLLKKLCFNGYAPKYNATAEDRRQWKLGMKYKVLYTKGHVQNNPKYLYAATKADLKPLIRIANRGLAKVMWGKNLGDIGAKVPLGIQRLIKKSPNLAHLPLNDVKFEQNDSITAVEITNKSNDSDGWGQSARERGYQSARAALAVRLKKIVEKTRSI